MNNNDDTSARDLANSFSLFDLLGDIKKKELSQDNDSGPGRGRKQCPECKTYVGVRTYVCDCGYSFTIDGKTKSLPESKKRELENVPTDDERLYAIHFGGSCGGKIVYACSGSCPVKFSYGTYDETISKCEELIDLGLKEGKIYLPSTIKHWIGHQVGFNSKQYQYLCEHIDLWAVRIMDICKNRLENINES